MKAPTKNTSKSLKIALVVDDGLDSEDGVQAYVKTLGAWLYRQGHTVHYLCGETRRTDIDNVFALAKNVKVVFNGNRLTMPLPVSNYVIKRHLEKEKYDVIHVQIPHSPFFGAKVARYGSKNSIVVSTFHILPYGFVAKYATKILGIYLSRNLKKFDLHISNSPACQEFSAWAFGIKSVLIPNMVDKAFYAKKSKTPQKIDKTVTNIVFLGRLVERKGCGYLLSALAELHTRRPDLRFRVTICGKGPLMEQLESHVKDMGLNSLVSFTGFVSNEQKVSYLQAADIAVFPSTAGESFGIVLVEAMFAGSGVVIGGDNPGYASVLAHTPEVLVDPKDAGAFSALLESLIEQPKLRASLHAKQQNFSAQFDVEVVGKQIVAEYRNCILKKNAR